MSRQDFRRYPQHEVVGIAALILHAFISKKGSAGPKDQETAIRMAEGLVEEVEKRADEVDAFNEKEAEAAAQAAQGGGAVDRGQV